MTPARLQAETDTAFAAFLTFVEVGGSTTKVARKLQCCRQNVTRWQRRHNWNKRLAAHRQAEAEHANQAEERAINAAAGITEERRAHVAQRAFAVAARMIEAADDLIEKNPHASSRLLATGVATVQAIGGAATAYAVPPVTVEVLNQYVNTEPQSPITTMEEADSIIAEFEAKHRKPELPCGGWNPNHADATPTPEPEPDVVTTPSFIPRRSIPTTGEPPRGHVKITGI